MKKREKNSAQKATAGILSQKNDSVYLKVSVYNQYHVRSILY